jgi:hypothetical protein
MKTKEKPASINGQRVCWATHPYAPNYSGTARSRVLHLSHLDSARYTFRATQCGMKIAKFVSEKEYGWLGRSLCKPCVTQSKAWINRSLA